MSSFILAGKKFKVMGSSTMERDIVMMNIVRASGLADVVLQAGEDPIVFAERVRDAALMSGKIFELLGCVLIPEEVEASNWTPALQNETAGYLKRLTADADKGILQSQIVSLISGFFQTGLLSFAISRKSSLAQTMTAEQPASASADTMTSEIGG